MRDKESLEAFLAETVDIIPPEIMKAVIEDLEADNLPDQETPDLQIVLPLLGKAYVERSDTLRTYGDQYLQKRGKFKRAP